MYDYFVMLTVFGSINVDIVCRVSSLPSTGETVLSSGHDFYCGGKGSNQAVAGCRAGSTTKMVGSVGDDSFSDFALSGLVSSGVDVEGVSRLDSVTGLALISVSSSGENIITVSSGANMLSRCDESFIGDVLLTQNEVSTSSLMECHGLGSLCGSIVIHNAAPSVSVDLDFFTPIDWLIVNESEFRFLCNLFEISVSDLRASVCILSDLVDCSIVVTLGSSGLCAYSRKKLYEVPALSVTVVDTTGAGDAFCGAFASALDQSMDIETSLRFGAVAGSLSCLDFGAQTSSPLRSSIISELERYS